MVRRVWPEQFGRSGYGLANLCNVLEIPLDRHHDALADALAAANLLLMILEKSGLALDDLVALCPPPTGGGRRSCRNHKKVSAPSKKSRPTAPRPEPDVNPDGPLFGHEIVFTGTLKVPRHEAAAHAKATGAEVGSNVTRAC